MDREEGVVGTPVNSGVPRLFHCGLVNHYTRPSLESMQVPCDGRQNQHANETLSLGYRGGVGIFPVRWPGQRPDL